MNVSRISLRVRQNQQNLTLNDKTTFLKITTLKTHKEKVAKATT